MLDIQNTPWIETPEFSQDSGTVLVVEDEMLVRLMICDALRDEGFRVLEAATVEEALLALMSGARIDLVFTDVKLPGPMSGLDLARHLAARLPMLPVVVTSGFPGSTTLPAGICFLAKPYRPEQVVSLISSRLSATPARSVA